MNTYHIVMRQTRGVQTYIEDEIRATSEAAATAEANRKFPYHTVISVSVVDDTKHQNAVAVAQILLRLASLSRDPRVKAISWLRRPISEVAVTIYEEVDQRLRGGNKSAEDIARSIFESALR